MMTPRLLALALVAACGGATKNTPDHEGPGNLPGSGGDLPDTGSGSGQCQPDPLGSDSCEPITEPSTKTKEPDVTVGPDVEVVGAIPKDSIHRVVRGHWVAIRQCYETLLLANPRIQGRVLAKFKVGIDGTVSDATATGVHPDLESCVTDTIRKFRFPKPDGATSVEVSYPLLFKPG